MQVLSLPPVRASARMRRSLKTFRTKNSTRLCAAVVVAAVVACLFGQTVSDDAFAVNPRLAGSERPDFAGRKHLGARHAAIAAEGADALTEAAPPAQSDEQLMTPVAATINIVKNIVGAGILSTSAGVASFSGSPKAAIPAFLITLMAGLLSAYGFILLGEACNRTKTATYPKAWAKTVDPNTAWLTSVACLFKAGTTVVAYIMILGDCISRILQPMDLPVLFAGRNGVIGLVTLFILAPLCSLKSLAPLAKFSTLGVLSNVYLCFFVALRFWDGSYRPGGAFFDAAPLPPAFDYGFKGNPLATAATGKIGVLVGILGTAFLAHYNAPSFYEQLEPNKAGEKSTRFKAVSTAAFALSACVFSIVMCGGFLTFGSNSAGLILNSYAATDPMAIMARIAVCISIIPSVPLAFLTYRKMLLEQVGLSNLSNSNPHVVLVVLLGSAMGSALILNDLGKLVGVVGALLGSFLIYIAPSLMGMGTPKSDEEKTGVGALVDGVLRYVMIASGAFIGVLGTYKTLFP